MLKEAWTLAIEALSWMEMRKLNERLALTRTAKQLGVEAVDALRLAHSLIFETVRRRNLIDRFINNALGTAKISELDLGLQSFLRLYVYQTRTVKNWSRVDFKEAENIAKLARSILGWETMQEVEPILGKLLTQKQSTILRDVSDEEKVGLTRFSPTWFVRYCFRLFGRNETLKLLESGESLLPIYIRLNTLKLNEGDILEKLSRDGVSTEKAELLKHTYKVSGMRTAMHETPSFVEGLFYVQDKASCYATEAARPEPGMSVLDVCAAPGAKTTYLAQLMRNRGRIFSVDYSKRRMNLWKDEITRMGVEIADPVVASASEALPCSIEADIAILDPPCTGTGTFSKLPSAKWRLTPRSIESMAQLQWRILDSCAGSVKSEGSLIYSTCSITVEENEMLIERFLKRHLEYSLEEITPKMGLPGLRGLEKCQRLYPHIDKCNGFFIAKLRKE